MREALADIESVDAYDADFRANASLSYALGDIVELQLFVLNLVGTGEQKRYSYDFGNNRAAPRRVRFVEEPRTVGIRIAYQP